MDIEKPVFNAAVATVLNMEKTALKVTLDDLVERTGMPKVSLQRYLSGERKMDMAQVRVIGAALGMDVPEVYAEAERRIQCDERRARAQAEGDRATS